MNVDLPAKELTQRSQIGFKSPGNLCFSYSGMHMLMEIATYFMKLTLTFFLMFTISHIKETVRAPKPYMK